MALTKTQLKEILSKAGVPAENADTAITAIMDGHLASVNALREERDKYKEDAEKLPGVQKELDDLKSNDDDSFKAKYEKEHEDFEAYKAEQAAKEVKAAKTDAFRSLLREAGISSKRIDTIVRASAPEIEGIKLDKDGKIKDSESMMETVKKDWSDFIVTKGSKGADTSTPPANNGGNKKSREEIYKKDERGRYVMDATQRQEALAELLSEGNNE